MTCKSILEEILRVLNARSDFKCLFWEFACRDLLRDMPENNPKGLLAAFEALREKNNYLTDYAIRILPFVFERAGEHTLAKSFKAAHELAG